MYSSGHDPEAGHSICMGFTGILTVLFLVSLYILLYKRRRQNRLDLPVLAVSCVMYLLALLVNAQTPMVMYV